MKGEERQSGKRQFALVKAYEISYAVFRVGSRITNAALKEHLERQALALLDAATVENYGWINTVSRAIEYLVRFGSDVGLIHDTNKEAILFQLQSLVAGIAGPEKTATAEEVPLADIFAGSEPLFPANAAKQNPAIRQNAAMRQSTVIRQNAATQQDIEIRQNPAMRQSGNGTGTGNGSGNSEDGEMPQSIRQSAILEKIRQSGNCRLKDIQDILPDCSERTIRYDLQTLVEEGSVERVGSGGPSIFYRMRQPAQEPMG